MLTAEGEERGLNRARTIVARLLVVLALIVQITAPTAATVAMVADAFDPLASAAICGHDGPDTGLPTADACRLCDLVCHGNGFAAAPTAPEAPLPATIVLAEVAAPRPTAPVITPPPSAFLARGPPRSA